MADEARKLSNKERMELFQSGVNALTTENEVSSVRQLLRQRYIKAKEEEEAVKKQQEAEKADEETKNRRELDTSKLGKQLRQVLRFGNRTRSRANPARDFPLHHRPRPEIDPFDDPHVLAANFAFDEQDDNGHHPDDGNPEREFPFMADTEDDDEDDDSFLSLLRHFVKNLTWTRLVWILFKITFYITCQIVAAKNGFGAACFAIALLFFICTNLRNRAPGELSAYSVFNPFCRPITGTVGDGQPQDNIVLLGNL